MARAVAKNAKAAERSGTITLWDDTVIEPGQKWRKKIEQALDLADVAVLLVSDNFLDSDFINKHELHPLLKAAEQKGVIILWVALSHCLYDEIEIAHYQAVHDPKRTLDSLPPHEQKKELAEICRKIKAAAQAKEKCRALKKRAAGKRGKGRRRKASTGASN